MMTAYIPTSLLNQLQYHTLKKESVFDMSSFYFYKIHGFNFLEISLNISESYISQDTTDPWKVLSLPFKHILNKHEAKIKNAVFQPS